VAGILVPIPVCGPEIEGVSGVTVIVAEAEIVELQVL
jgi:hypothetical protein